MSRKWKLVFSPSLRIWSYKALVKAFESSRRDLAIEEEFRACFKNKKESWMLIFFAMTTNGGQPSVLLQDSIMSKAPGGKKEIDVYKLNHWRKRKENEEFLNFLFSAWWFLDVKEVFFRPYIVCRWKNESRDLLLSPSRSNLGLVSSRFAGFVRNREI